MATAKYTLTPVPVRISDGTKKVFVQSDNGAQFRFADSTTSPNTGVFLKASELSIAEGFFIWAWNPSNTPLTITVATSI